MDQPPPSCTQDHLLREHPDSAIITVERGDPESKSRTDDLLTSRATEEVSLESDLDDRSIVHPSPDALGESLADISNSNFFSLTRDLSDEILPSDLF